MKDSPPPAPVELSRTRLQTPLGPMDALASHVGLCALEFITPDRIHRLEGRLQRWFAPFEIRDSLNQPLETVRDWLAAYFRGHVANAGPTPLDLRGTEFERRVWECLLQVPAGTTFTYGGIAERLGTPQGARAVGHAVGSNPVSIIVPCHRIVGAAGQLTGYGGGLDKKQWLLRHELEWYDKKPGRLF
jgi:O-6-methylguanine DNA methyltransferase